MKKDGSMDVIRNMAIEKFLKLDSKQCKKLRGFQSIKDEILLSSMIYVFVAIISIDIGAIVSVIGNTVEEPSILTVPIDQFEPIKSTDVTIRIADVYRFNLILTPDYYLLNLL